MSHVLNTANHERLLKQRVVVLDGEINEPNALELAAKLLYLQNEEPNAPIHFFVDSPGGR